MGPGFAPRPLLLSAEQRPLHTSPCLRRSITTSYDKCASSADFITIAIPLSESFVATTSTSDHLALQIPPTSSLQLTRRVNNQQTLSSDPRNKITCHWRLRLISHSFQNLYTEVLCAVVISSHPHITSTSSIMSSGESGRTESASKTFYASVSTNSFPSQFASGLHAFLSFGCFSPLRLRIRLRLHPPHYR